MNRTATISFCLLLLITLLSGCSSGFTIKGNIQGLASQNLRVTYATPTGVKEVWTQAREDRFELKGDITGGPTLVIVADATARVIARFVLEAGDDVKVRGNLSDLYRLECKGPEVCEQWMQFHTDNATFFQSSETDQINQKIEQYVAAHPDDELSTVLLLFDYSRAAEPARVEQLLAKINPEAKPKALIDIWNQLKKATEGARAPQVGSMVMLSSSGDFEALNPSLGKKTLLWLWVQDMDHSTQVQQLKQLKQSNPTLQVADVFLDPDSGAWRPLLTSDQAPWHHYWAPEGPTSTALKPLGITVVPCFVVLDDRGKVLYHGTDFTAAKAALK